MFSNHNSKSEPTPTRRRSIGMLSTAIVSEVDAGVGPAFIMRYAA